MTFEYNYLNLPKLIQATGGQIELVYDASGRKLIKRGPDGDREYILGIEYIYGQLESIAAPDGRLVAEYDEASGTILQGYRPEYWRKDRLGNTRLSFSDLDNNGVITYRAGQALEIMQEAHYYPFGMQQAGDWYATVTPENKYLYNGKELNKDFGIDLYDYGARWYDPALGRFTGVDPLADKYPSISSYAYVLNNPIRHTDPDGRSVDGEYEQGKDGSWVKVSNKGDAIGVDFYHFNASESKPQQTYVTDREGNWNIINNGRYALQGEVRGSDVNWETIYNEFSTGTGPERSIFEGNHPSNTEIQSHYAYQEALSSFEASGQSKAGTEVSFSPLDIPKTGGNMQAQMMGSYNASFYKLGDKTLSLLQDSKSRTSLYYHLPVTNYSRATGRYTSDFNPNANLGLGPYTGHRRVHITSETNTYQSYVFLNR